jgi:hypothetical protein
MTKPLVIGGYEQANLPKCLQGASFVQNQYRFRCWPAIQRIGHQPAMTS